MNFIISIKKKQQRHWIFQAHKNINVICVVDNFITPFRCPIKTHAQHLMLSSCCSPTTVRIGFSREFFLVLFCFFYLFRFYIYLKILSHLLLVDSVAFPIELPALANSRSTIYSMCIHVSIAIIPEKKFLCTRNSQLDNDFHLCGSEIYMLETTPEKDIKRKINVFRSAIKWKYIYIRLYLKRFL